MPICGTGAAQWGSAPSNLGAPARTGRGVPISDGVRFGAGRAQRIGDARLVYDLARFVLGNGSLRGSPVRRTLAEVEPGGGRCRRSSVPRTKR